MPNDSSTAGYLSPSAAPPYDDALADILHDAIAGITGLPDSLVRPRWQPEPPPRPAFDVDWVAFGVSVEPADTFAWQGTVGPDYEVQRDELVRVLHSFYGPNCESFERRLRDGLALSQNRDGLKANNINLIEVQDPVKLPRLLQEKWVQRVDVTIVYRRRTSRKYAVLPVEIFQAGLDNEDYFTPINVTLP
jgi:hypothetical protein